MILKLTEESVKTLPRATLEKLLVLADAVAQEMFDYGCRCPDGTCERCQIVTRYTQTRRALLPHKKGKPA